MHDNHRAAVAGFYETHPINEEEILQRLAGRGFDLGKLTEQELKEFDQDHYGGVEAVDALAEAARISRGQHVLDVGRMRCLPNARASSNRQERLHSRT